jgi:hypothetical protein
MKEKGSGCVSCDRFLGLFALLKQHSFPAGEPQAKRDADEHLCAWLPVAFHEPCIKLIKESTDKHPGKN